MRRNTRLGTTITAILLAPSATLAQVDTSDWNCEYCPFDDGYRAEIDAGAAYVSDDAARFGNGTGLDEKGGYVDLGGDGRYLKDGVEMSWHASDLGLDSRELGISVGRPGTYSIELGYDELPYRLFDSTSTIFSTSGNSLTVPSSWTAAGTTSGFADLAESLQPQNIGKDRQIFEFGASYLPSSNVKVYADYRRQQRDGINIMAGSTFTQAAFLPRPIDDYTDSIDAGVRFSAGSLNLALAWYGSFYRNDIDSLVWDNPFAFGLGNGQGRFALEPDNDFQQFSLSGVYRAATYNTVVAFSAAMGRGEQNHDFLPYTINSQLVTTALPMTSLDGQVDTNNYALTVTSRPHTRLNLKLAYRFDERDNQTPVAGYTRVIADAFTTGTPESNIPYSFERSRLNLSGSLRLFDTVKVSGGYDRTDLDRDYQEVAEQSEDTGWGKIRWRPTGYLEASFRGGASRREIDEYNTDIAVSLGQNPLLRKYNLAYRYREFGELVLSASLPEKPVSISMTYLFADDSYTESELGITESEEERFTVDFSWAVSENSSVYLTAGNESINAIQVGNDVTDWQASHDDDFTHYGGGFRVAGESDKYDLTLDYTRSEGETEILYAGQAVATSALPELTSEMDSLRLSLNYNISERFDANLAIRYERFETADWALDGVAPDTIPTILTMGADAWDYDVWVIGIGFRYRTGGDSE
jgi:MtrB/PioB family decaheme-associated outer membrane protein